MGGIVITGHSGFYEAAQKKSDGKQLSGWVLPGWFLLNWSFQDWSFQKRFWMLLDIEDCLQERQAGAAADAPARFAGEGSRDEMPAAARSMLQRSCCCFGIQVFQIRAGGSKRHSSALSDFSPFRYPLHPGLDASLESLNQPAAGFSSPVFFLRLCGRENGTESADEIFWSADSDPHRIRDRAAVQPDHWAAVLPDAAWLLRDCWSALLFWTRIRKTCRIRDGF